MNLSSGNFTYAAEAFNASVDELWLLILKVALIIIFILIATWFFSDDTKSKEIKELTEEIRRAKQDIIEVIKKDRENEKAEKTNQTRN